MAKLAAVCFLIQLTTLCLAQEQQAFANQAAAVDTPVFLQAPPALSRFASPTPSSSNADAETESSPEANSQELPALLLKLFTMAQQLAPSQNQPSAAPQPAAKPPVILDGQSQSDQPQIINIIVGKPKDEDDESTRPMTPRFPMMKWGAGHGGASSWGGRGGQGKPHMMMPPPFIANMLMRHFGKYGGSGRFSDDDDDEDGKFGFPIMMRHHRAGMWDDDDDDDDDEKPWMRRQGWMDDDDDDDDWKRGSKRNWSYDDDDDDDDEEDDDDYIGRRHGGHHGRHGGGGHGRRHQGGGGRGGRHGRGGLPRKCKMIIRRLLWLLRHRRGGRGGQGPSRLPFPFNPENGFGGDK